MRFVPDHTLHIISEQDFPQEIEQIDRTLDTLRHEGEFRAADGQKLYYEYFLAADNKGSVVIVHGMSEFTKKFYELTYYLLNKGYNVFLYDQRCHGFSCRLTDQNDLVHVDTFDDYVSDLEIFIDTIVKKEGSTPLYLYGHSMGGAVCTFYLAKHRDTIRKAVITSPMFMPQIGGIPPFIARSFTRITLCFDDPKKRFKYASDFDPDRGYEKSSDASKNRFLRHIGLRLKYPQYRSTPITVGWFYQSMIQKRRLLHRRITHSIQTPILMFTAENDRVVRNKPQEIFAKKCAVCTRRVMKGAKHALLCGTSETVSELMQAVFEFYNS